MTEIALQKATWILEDILKTDSGGFGTVWSASSDLCTEAVIKLIEKQPGADRELLIGDALVAAELRNVIPVLDSGETDTKLAIAMPRADFSLAQYLEQRSNQLDRADALKILADVSTALEAISGHVVHRDLKPQNILRWRGVWCLADFGLARYAEAATGPQTWKDYGTAPYMAPEQWRMQHATAATDVYALGIIAYELLAGHRPFPGPEGADFRDQHLNQTPPTLHTGSPQLSALVEECLYKAPEARPSPANLQARISKLASGGPQWKGTALAEAAHRVARETAEEQAQQEQARDRADKQADLVEAARSSMQSIRSALQEAIAEVAANAEIRSPSPSSPLEYTVTLGSSGGELSLLKVRPAEPWDGPFNVAATSAILVKQNPSGPYGYSGRLHSLWYCDADSEGHYGWFELAFMDGTIGFRNHHATEPYGAEPPNAAVAFMSVIGASPQLAWPLQRLHRDDLTEFIERWLDWFGQAVGGRLSHPSTMPERSTAGSWRK